MVKEEGHYTIKRIKKLPKKGNANWLYILKDQSPVSILYRWDNADKQYEDIQIGSVFTGGGIASINGDIGPVVALTTNDIPVFTDKNYTTDAEILAIGTNTTNIGINTTDIGTNATNIGTNATDIGTNTTDIGTNTTNIGNNTTDIGTNTTNIGTNTTDIGTNVTAISLNTAKVSFPEAPIDGIAKSRKDGAWYRLTEQEITGQRQTFPLTSGDTVWNDQSQPTGSGTKVVNGIVRGNFNFDLPAYYTPMPNNDPYDGTAGIGNLITINLINGISGQEMIYYSLTNITE